MCLPVHPTDFFSSKEFESQNEASYPHPEFSVLLKPEVTLTKIVMKLATWYLTTRYSSIAYDTDTAVSSIDQEPNTWFSKLQFTFILSHIVSTL